MEVDALSEQIKHGSAAEVPEQTSELLQTKWDGQRLHIRMSVRIANASAERQMRV
jgi:hypothetical protein